MGASGGLAGWECREAAEGWGRGGSGGTGGVLVLVLAGTRPMAPPSHGIPGLRPWGAKKIAFLFCAHQDSNWRPPT